MIYRKFRGGIRMIQEISLGNVMVDCDNEQKLCEFYHQLLGWEKCELYERPGVRSENGIVFLFIQEKEYVPPVWPEESGKQQKQMHFDFQVPDVLAAVQQAQTLGAVKVELQFGGKYFTTMIDPAGHPFCLCANDNVS